MFYLIIVLYLTQSIECAMEPFIVKGQDANIEEFPYSVFMFMSCLSPKSYWSCGSSILNQRIVLTAAHCLTGCSQYHSSVKVFVGHRGRAKGQASTVSDFYVHEEHNTDSSCSDIALARLKTDMQLGNLVQRVAVLRRPPNVKVAELAGWGLINEQVAVNAKTLQKTKQIIIKRPECQRRMKNIPQGAFCGDSMDGHSFASGLLGFIACEKKTMIVNGTVTKIEEFPHAVLISIRCNIDGDLLTAYNCGAFILNNRIVMSAAHCIADYGPGSRTSISVGQNTIGFFLLGFIACEKKPMIVDGDVARIEDFPHSALMSIQCKFRHGERAIFQCGASILNHRITMSAAHCLVDCGPGSRASISVGKNTIGGQKTLVKRYVIHEHYDGWEVINDIALMNLRTALNFGIKVQRVALMANPPYNEKAIVAGWGLVNEETLEESPYLHYVDQYVWTAKDCKVMLGRAAAGTLCASSRNITSFASKGDSGSALVVRGYIQIGIVSYKVPRVSRSLVVYTDTGYFYDWITHHTRRLYCA